MLTRDELDKKNFLSDVGGTAGLILGMSFATVIGLIDILLQQTFKFVTKYAEMGRKCALDFVTRLKVTIKGHSTNLTNPQIGSNCSGYNVNLFPAATI